MGAKRISCARSTAEALGDDEWAGYLFMRANPRGPFAERWVHSAGCRRWFNLMRDTATDRVIRRVQAGEKPLPSPANKPERPAGRQAP